MEQEILTTLQEIRGLLFLLTSALCLVVLILFLRNLGRVFKYYKSLNKNRFNKEVGSEFASRDYSKVLGLCEEKLKKSPDHLDALWWLAKAKKEIGEKQEARELFERLIELEPSWENEIEPYLKKRL